MQHAKIRPTLRRKIKRTSNSAYATLFYFSRSTESASSRHNFLFTGLTIPNGAWREITNAAHQSIKYQWIHYKSSNSISLSFALSCLGSCDVKKNWTDLFVLVINIVLHLCLWFGHSIENLPLPDQTGKNARQLLFISFSFYPFESTYLLFDEMLWRRWMKSILSYASIWDRIRQTWCMKLKPWKKYSAVMRFAF